MPGEVKVINILQQVVNKSGGYHRPLLLIRSFVRTEARNVLPAVVLPHKIFRRNVIYDAEAHPNDFAFNKPTDYKRTAT